MLSRYRCNMTTATKDTRSAPAARPRQPDVTPAVDLETRLALAGAGMDAVLAHRHADALAGARAAVREAQSTLPPVPEDNPGFPYHRVLARAAELIRERGWVRHEYESADGALCAVQAIRTVAGEGTLAAADAEAELLRRIRDDVGDAFGIPQWNDSRSGVGEVLRLLG